MADAPPQELPPLDECGFVQVPSDGDQALWMTCESCGKSDHFWLDSSQEPGAVNCRCGARYSWAVRPDGSQVPVAELQWTAFKAGPARLGSWEWDPVRVAVLVGLVSAIVAGAVAWIW